MPFRKLQNLVEHPLNAEIFVDSFAPEDIQALAKDIDEKGLASPILVAEVDGQAMIIDGHRRYRAYQYLKDLYSTSNPNPWDDIEFRDLGRMTLDEGLQRILALGAHTKKTTPRESYNVFKQAQDLLKRSHGRSWGGPRIKSKVLPSRILPETGNEVDEEATLEQQSSAKQILDSTLKDSKEILKLAAAQAGITVNRAKELKTIFESAPPEVLADLAAGKKTIKAAYSAAKRANKPPKEPKTSLPVESSTLESSTLDSSTLELSPEVDLPAVEAVDVLTAIRRLIDASDYTPQEVLAALKSFYSPEEMPSEQDLKNAKWVLEAVKRKFGDGWGEVLAALKVLES